LRLFIALALSADVRKRFASLLVKIRAFAPQAKWVRPENLHVTLKFLGETSPAQLGAIREALATIRSERAIELHFHRLGFFPDEEHPRVFWAAMDASPNLPQLAAEISHALEPLGLPSEQRPLLPHLTLARFEPPAMPQALPAAVQQYSGRSFGSLCTSEFHLIESQLKPTGAQYTTLHSFRFSL
jgi:RNA 2',3'-cyclic 3'-phosphodiesterase